ncbi:MAG: ArnT family glycosyltransferase [bacterium]
MPQTGIAAMARKEIVLIIATGLIAALICIASFDETLSTIGDNAEFIILARSILSGHGYRMLNDPSLKPNTKYPPGFPAMLAGWAVVAGDSIVAMKAFVVVTLVISSMIAYLLARRFLSMSLSFLSVLMVITSWNVIKYAFDTLSDVPYMMVSLVALLLLVEVPRSRSTICGSLIAIGSSMVRTVGLSLVIASWLELLLKKRWKILTVSILIFVIVVGGWTLRNTRVSGSASRYTEILLLKNPYNQQEGRIDFRSFTRRVGINFKEYTTYYISYNVIPTFLEKTGGRESPGSRLLGGLTFFVSILGVYSMGKRNKVLPVYLCFYLAIYLVWPEVWTGERFMLPIAPIICIGLSSGLMQICDFFGWSKKTPVFLASLVILSNLFTLIPYMGSERGYSPGWQHYLEIAEWAKENTTEDSVFLCRKPFLFYVVSSRKTIGYPMTTDKEEVKRYLYEQKPDYIVIEKFDARYSTSGLILGPALVQMTDELEIVFETEEPVNFLLKFSPKEGWD